MTVDIDSAPLLVREIDCTAGAPLGVGATLRLTVDGTDVQLDWFRSPSAGVTAPENQGQRSPPCAASLGVPLAPTP